jgi:Flp pilus assembly protein TadG
MIFGTTELGRAIYSYNTLDKSVRDAARHLSQHGPGEIIIADEARCLAAYGKLLCGAGDPPLVPGLTPSMVKICDAANYSACPYSHAAVTIGSGATGTVVNLVTVRIEGYTYNSLVEFVIPDLTFSNISVTMRGQL